MNKYTDIDELYASVKANVGAYWSEGEEVKEACLYEIENATVADVAAVVRCKDCIYSRFNTSSLQYKCDRRGYFSEAVEPSDYCSKGKNAKSEDKG
jgi:hypothetical protein